MNANLQQKQWMGFSERWKRCEYFVWNIKFWMLSKHVNSHRCLDVLWIPEKPGIWHSIAWRIYYRCAFRIASNCLINSKTAFSDFQFVHSFHFFSISSISANIMAKTTITFLFLTMHLFKFYKKNIFPFKSIWNFLKIYRKN